MRVATGSDHAGFALKETVKTWGPPRFTGSSTSGNTTRNQWTIPIARKPSVRRPGNR